MLDVTGKVALVTGGARGIGAAIVRALASAGAEVVIHYGQSRERALALAAAVGGDRCHPVHADLSFDTAPAALWREAVDWRGRVDVLVNNAGIYEPTPPDGDFEAWTQGWHRTLQINLIAAAHLCREAVAHFRGRGGGIVVNIASRSAFRGDAAEYMDYAASKGGLVALTRGLARAYAADGVLAYVVAPGFVRTEMVEEFVKTVGEEAAAGDIPTGQMASPDDVAAVTLFLASGKARHATGATIDINGASFMH